MKYWGVWWGMVEIRSLEHDVAFTCTHRAGEITLKIPVKQHTKDGYPCYIRSWEGANNWDFERKISRPVSDRGGVTSPTQQNRAGDLATPLVSMRTNSQRAHSPTSATEAGTRSRKTRRRRARRNAVLRTSDRKREALLNCDLLGSDEKWNFMYLLTSILNGSRDTEERDAATGILKQVIDQKVWKFF